MLSFQSSPHIVLITLQQALCHGVPVPHILFPYLSVFAVLLAEMVKADKLLTGTHWKLCHSMGMGKKLRKADLHC